MYPTVNDATNPLRDKGSRLLQQLISLLVCCALLLMPVCTVDALSDTQQLVVDSWRLVNQAYWDPEGLTEARWKRQRQKAMEKSIQSSEDAYSAIEVMLSALNDPYTRLLRPQDYAALKNSTSGNLSGVGLQLGPDLRADRLVVISTLDGSPAADADIASGTRLIKVDGQTVDQLGLEGAVRGLRGDVGSQVVLTLLTQTDETREVTLERRSVDLRPVRTRRLRSGSHTFGYLRITQFSEGVPQKVQEALEELQTKEIEGLLLDLRNNSGGLVSSGLAVANDFLSGDAIVETRNRNGIEDTIQADSATLRSRALPTQQRSTPVPC